MKKFCLFVLCAALITTTAGCGTIKGLGEDISTVGRWLMKGSDSAKSPATK
jgi:predicted small secreted protein